MKGNQTVTIAILAEGAELLDQLGQRPGVPPETRERAVKVASLMRQQMQRMAPPLPYNGLCRALNYARGHGEVDATG